MKSAIPFGQGQILNPYLSHYRGAFAFSLFLYPPRSSASVTFGLLTGIDHLSDPVGLILLFRLVFFSWLGWFLSPGRALVPHLNKGEALSSVYLPFWLRRLRDNFASYPITGFKWRGSVLLRYLLPRCFLFSLVDFRLSFDFGQLIVNSNPFTSLSFNLPTIPSCSLPLISRASVTFVTCIPSVLLPTPAVAGL